jgi:hypothetical protein
MRNSRIAFACAAALAASSVAQSAAAAPAPIEPAAEHVEGSALRSPLGIAAIVAVIALLILLVGNLLDNDTGAVPASP